jgi:hypothetical protein
LGVFELVVRDENSSDDIDGDGLTNDDETTLYNTDPENADTDGDGLSDGEEVLTHETNPLLADSDDDGFDDRLEIQQGTDPSDPASVPGNVALTATAIVGINDAIDSDAGTPLEHAGVAAAINDGNFATSVDTFGGADENSFVGLLWDEPLEQPVDRVEVSFAIFFDGGWFGPNGSGPGTGGCCTIPITSLRSMGIPCLQWISVRRPA